MSESFEVTDVMPADPQRVYQAWMDSEQHGWMTATQGEIDPQVGGRFNVGDGYISGTTLELQPFHRIVQAWRTTEFPDDAPDSRLEVLLEPAEGGTRITLNHSEIPDDQGEEYLKGWRMYYFAPMKEYFTDLQQA
jgi:uncharacterized protein YndB with AHSA1/START domain